MNFQRLHQIQIPEALVQKWWAQRNELNHRAAQQSTENIDRSSLAKIVDTYKTYNKNKITSMAIAQICMPIAVTQCHIRDTIMCKNTQHHPSTPVQYPVLLGSSAANYYQQTLHFKSPYNDQNSSESSVFKCNEQLAGPSSGIKAFSPNIDQIEIIYATDMLGAQPSVNSALSNNRKHTAIVNR